MCGICGAVGKGLTTSRSEAIIARMMDALSHRGPDGKGAHAFEASETRMGGALGHHRLAILDLSDAGLQPMSSPSGRLWIAFNGEVYNFQELRATLEAEGVEFRSRTDTEVVLALYARRGPDFVRELRGMFALAILDLDAERLVLARDALGIKPLYYASTGDTFLFASELKAVLASGLVDRRVDWQAISDYFTYLYVPCPQTAFEGVRQLPPGHRLVLDLRDGSSRVDRYWRVRRRPEIEHASPEAIRAMLREALSASVRRQLVSDVPLGVFLSGGVDSGIVAGLARAHAPDVETFTLGFADPDAHTFDERDLARAQARHAGTRHRELVLDRVDPAEILKLALHFDQPFANPTLHLQYLLCREARPHVKVALSGAGGDELFAGYPRYRARRLARRLRRVPAGALRAAGRALGRIPVGKRSTQLRRARDFLEGADQDPIRAFVRWTYFLDEEEKARLLPPGARRSRASADRVVRAAVAASELREEDARFLEADVSTFLLDNLLAYTDMMGMLVPLEVRVPLLDEEFVELALNVPYALKLDEGTSKKILREAFEDLLAPEVLHAPKRGFNLPLSQWVEERLDPAFDEGPAREQIERALGSRLGLSFRDGVLDRAFVEELRREHRSGRADRSNELLAIMIFDAWWGRLPSEARART